MEELQFLPTNKEEMQRLGLDQVDFVMVTGDAYVDHPSFGTSLIARYLESFGYSVAILSQPDYHNPKSIMSCSKPRLGFLVSAGNIDSMVNHYYVSKKRRKKDVYTVNGKPNQRPDDATITYCKMIRAAYGDIPIIIGGIEASLRRFTHYDYIKDKLRPSILIESGADILVYSMGEKAMLEIADYLASGLAVKELTFIAGTCIVCDELLAFEDSIVLDAYETIIKDKKAYANSFNIQYQNNEAQSAKVLVEPYQTRFVVQNIAQTILSNEQFDHLYDLPFTYESYDEIMGNGIVSALEEIKFSITVNRGCNGGCHFCAITFHQGKQLSMRSKSSVVSEAKKMMTLQDFKGYIHDVGGPTANFNDQMCQKLQSQGSCHHQECFAPTMCKNINVSHANYFDMLKAVREIEGIKKVFVRSGIRYDYLLQEPNEQYLIDLVKYHVSGQLRLAPEHYSDQVLAYMNKPSIKLYDDFVKQFNQVNKALDMKQYIVPYLMSSHPGTHLQDALELAIYLKKINYRPLQVQDFFPTPSTMSTIMYYTGIHPKTNQEVCIVKDEKQRQMQRALLQCHLPQNYELVLSALTQLKRLDLVNFGPQGLIKPVKR